MVGEASGGGATTVGLCVMTYNTMLTTSELIRQNGQKTRARLIPQAIARYERSQGLQIDAVVLTEVIDTSSTEILLAGFVREGWRFQTRPLQRGLLADWPPKLVGGGVYIVSKHPISHQSSAVFKDACVEYDCLASKGCVLAKIWKPAFAHSASKQPHARAAPPVLAFNILGTHLQAWDSATTNKVRHSQVQQINTFLKRQRKKKWLRVSEPLIFAGDFNVDLYGSVDEFEGILTHLRLRHVAATPLMVAQQQQGEEGPLVSLGSLARSGSDGSVMRRFVEVSAEAKGGTAAPSGAQVVEHYFSSDPETNTLVGNDMIETYRMQHYPEGCYEKYMETMRCPCCPQEMLDHVFLAKDHAQPLQEGGASCPPSAWVVGLKAKDFFVMNYNVTTKRETRDLSDHYPVVASMSFEVPLKNQTPNPYLVSSSFPSLSPSPAAAPGKQLSQEKTKQEAAVGVGNYGMDVTAYHSILPINTSVEGVTSVDNRYWTLLIVTLLASVAVFFLVRKFTKLTPSKKTTAA